MNNVEINGIYYNLNECEKTAQVTNGPDEHRGAVSIPETVSYNGKTYTVTSIGNEAFCGCSGLTSVNIGNSVTCIGNEAFWGCSELTSVNIPGSVTNIADWAFGFCSGLTSVNIPNSVTNIGDSAFAFCSGLTSINIPDSVTNIGDSAFDDCSGLTSINVETGNTIYDSRNNCNAIIETATNTLITGCKNTTIPNSVTSIGDDAFWGCNGLTSINIPDSVTSIGDEAFCHCSGLRSINISNSVTSIGKWAFHNCEGLTSVNIPDSVTNIGDSVFDDCSGLTSINVETGNTIYDSRNNCNAIIETATNTLITGCKNTTIPNSVTSIGDNAFWGCKGLTSVNIPNSVTSIGDFAFDGSKGLTSINIPDSVTSIGDHAFADCKRLADVYCYAENVPSTKYNVFNNSDIKKATLHVPAASIEQYKTTEPWSNLGTIVAIDDTETQAS